MFHLSIIYQGPLIEFRLDIRSNIIKNDICNYNNDEWWILPLDKKVSKLPFFSTARIPFTFQWRIFIIWFSFNSGKWSDLAVLDVDVEFEVLDTPILKKSRVVCFLPSVFGVIFFSGVIEVEIILEGMVGLFLLLCDFSVFSLIDLLSISSLVIFDFLYTKY